MYIDYNKLFETLNMPENNTYVMIGFLLVCAIVIALRIIICLGYQSNYIFFNVNAKEIKSRGDIKNLKFGLLSRVATDYMRLGEKGISTVNTSAIIEKHLLKLNFIGWSYNGMASFVNAFENGVVFIGALFAFVFSDYRFVYAIATVAAFLLLRLFGSIFDFELLRKKLSSEILEYVEREVGQYYAGDLNSVILRLKNDLTAAMKSQSDATTTVIRKMGDDLTGAVKLSLQNVSREMSQVIEKVSNTGEILNGPLENWRKSIAEAGSLQKKINDSMQSLEKSSSAFSEVSGTIGTTLTAYSEKTSEQTESISRALENLIKISAEIKESNTSVLSMKDALESQLRYIEKNQAVLEQSIQQYEHTLQDAAQKIGDGMGSIVSYNMQTAYGSLNSALEENIKQIITNNNETIQRFKEILEQMREQSHSETQAIMKIKEQMDLHFEKLSDRIL